MFWRIWSFALIIKLFLAWRMPLFADEMYYWVWSHHLSLSYFDHPPFIAWLIRLGHVFENLDGAVRWPTVIFGHLVPVIWFQIVKRFFSVQNMSLWFSLCLLSPTIGLGTIVAVPDVPLLVFWSLAFYFFLSLLEKNSWTNYISLGAALGLGFCSKYHIALFLPLGILYLTYDKKWRALSAKKSFASALVAIVFSLPVFIWNYQNDWASFRFQLERGFGQAFKLFWVTDYLGAQLLLIFPIIFFFAFRASKSGANRALSFFGWGPFVFFFISSFKGRVEPNWTTIGTPALITLALMSGTSIPWIRFNRAIWLIVAALLTVIVSFQWLPGPEWKLKTNEFSAYDGYLPYVSKYQPFFAGSYQMASALYYKSRIPVFKLAGTHRKDHFDYMAESHPKTPKFYAIISVWSDNPRYFIEEYTLTVLKPDLPEDHRLLEFNRK